MGEARCGDGERGEASAESTAREAERQGAKARRRPLREDLGAHNPHELGERDFADGGEARDGRRRKKRMERAPRHGHARLVAPLDQAAAAGSNQLRALIGEVASPGAEEHARAAHEYGDNGDDGAEYEQERAQHDVDGGASLLVRAGLARVEECGGAKEDPQAVEGGEAEEEEQPAWLGLGVRVRVGVGFGLGLGLGLGLGFGFGLGLGLGLGFGLA